MKKKYLIFLLLLSFPLYTWADKTLDSLLNVLDLTIQGLTRNFLGVTICSFL